MIIIFGLIHSDKNLQNLNSPYIPKFIQQLAPPPPTLNPAPEPREYKISKVRFDSAKLVHTLLVEPHYEWVAQILCDERAMKYASVWNSF